jgi:hypothetical protein
MDEHYRAELSKIAESMARRHIASSDATSPEDLSQSRTNYRHLAELTGLVRIEPEPLRQDPQPEPEIVAAI